MSDNKFIRYTLGCGSAKPTLRHLPSCTVLNIHGRLIMIDCGEGAQLSMLRQRLSPARLTDIFLTHLHGDHVLGLPGLLGTMALGHHDRPVTIHTFAEGIEMLRTIMGYFNEGSTLDVKYNLITPTDDIIYEDNTLRISTVSLNHRVPDVGFIFEEQPKERHIDIEKCTEQGVPFAAMKSLRQGCDFVTACGDVIANEELTTPPTPSIRYAHISDTAYMPGLADRIGAVDLLFHETTYLEQHADLARQRWHSTAAQAARVAKESGAKFLLTGHYSSRYAFDDEFLAEAQSIFPRTILNDEGLVLELHKSAKWEI